jgi:hypothetical protein
MYDLEGNVLTLTYDCRAILVLALLIKACFRYMEWLVSRTKSQTSNISDVSAIVNNTGASTNHLPLPRATHKGSHGRLASSLISCSLIRYQRHDHIYTASI